VAILDADKEGFLRSAGSLIQTMGVRAASGRQGDPCTRQITIRCRRAMDETDRRRRLSLHTMKNRHTPQSIINTMDMGLAQILSRVRRCGSGGSGGLPSSDAGRPGCIHREDGDGDARGGQEVPSLRKQRRLRASIKELKEKEILFG